MKSKIDYLRNDLGISSSFSMESTIKGGLLRCLIVVLVKGKTIRASILPMESTIMKEML